MKSLLCCCLLWLCLPLAVHAAELRIDLGHGAKTWSTAELLDRADATTVAIPDDVAFQRPMRYRAVPLLALLPGLSAGQHLQFVAADGFAAEIPAALLLNRQGSQAWLAVEDPAQPWPALAENAKDAGPFYLVWTHPQGAHVSPEQWPYQLAAIRTLPGVDARFPAMVPAVDATAAVRQGFDVFKRTCFACHTMNGEGDSKLGPDLNLPYSPTEYLRADLLRGYVRNPQSLHRWPGARMMGFPTQESLSDADLDAVLDYLRYMAKHKAAH
ncbi:cytochrome c [Rhodanobacter sp. DHB23]|uniref:c-type cytochrome n=1 Tax=Rhodanobacter sp. DHB23 TaxID=2775923 RepID=UPI001786778C|nr:cytochrome c [Rhodanobacter sp. DHB23]MBD8873054.1 cytochrome c [Rhodanobacter sp. DHB23]